jgi:hypothetical protein
VNVILPWANTPNDEIVIKSHARTLVGETLTGAAYLLPASSDETHRVARPGFHEASMGVELMMADGPVGLIWLMEGVKEGLALVLGEPIDLPRGGPAKKLPATQFTDWQNRLGEITTIGLAWHVPEEAGPRTIWSWRLGIRNGRSVTIALGEWRAEAGNLTYQPDNVVVIFQEDIARRYRIPASDEPAWGNPI